MKSLHNLPPLCDYLLICTPNPRIRRNHALTRDVVDLTYKRKIIKILLHKGYPHKNLRFNHSRTDHVYDFILATTNLRCLFIRFRDIEQINERFARRVSISSVPSPIPDNIYGCFLWSRSVLLRCAERRKVSRLISREIIFEEFQPKAYMTTIPQRHRRTD